MYLTNVVSTTGLCLCLSPMGVTMILRRYGTMAFTVHLCML